MKKKVLKVTILAILGAVAGLALISSRWVSYSADHGLPDTGLANPNNLLSLYTSWKGEFEKDGGARNLVLSLAWSPSSSTVDSRARGKVDIDLIDGRVTSEVKGLKPDLNGYELWLVDNEKSFTPSSGDRRLFAGTFKRLGDFDRLEADLGRGAFDRFRPRTVVVTRRGAKPEDNRVLVGSTTLFQSLYFSEMDGRFGDIGPRRSASAKHSELLARLINALFPTAEAVGQSDGLTATVAAGRDLFLNETFGGNGRTCATCHRENLSFTLNPQFISTLPPTDPLFVAETNPNLAQLENPAVMRATACILENHDGFDKPGVLRGIPHLLALGLSTKNAFSDVRKKGFTQALGWSGDGAPIGPIDDGLGGTIMTSGTLRDFAIGAVRQHFTKTLDRRAGVDFVYPTPTQLDELEAFLLSLGRQSDLQLDPAQANALILKGQLANLGQQMFRKKFGETACDTCHHNAGADVAKGTNINFDTHVEDLPATEQPSRLIDPSIPKDDGFPGKLRPNSFNVPPLVEASFTAPFFHNNSVNTLEVAVQFYSFAFSPQFFPNASDQAFQPSQGFTPTTVQAIAAFIRVIGSLEKIRSSASIETDAEDPSVSDSDAVDMLQLAQAELRQGVNVLTQGNLHPNAVNSMNSAIGLLEQAIESQSTGSRNQLIEQARTAQTTAKSDMEVQGP